MQKKNKQAVQNSHKKVHPEKSSDNIFNSLKSEKNIKTCPMNALWDYISQSKEE